MFDLNKDDMLSKIYEYKLDRPDGWCNISVHEIIASENAKVEFIAVPHLGVLQAEREHFGVGDTLEDALGACLSKIKSVSIEALFPKLDEAYK